MSAVRTIPRHLPPFCYAERDLREIRGIVVHYISAVNVAPERPFAPAEVHGLLLDLNRPAAERDFHAFEPAERLHASYHFLIGRRGGIYRLVPLPRVAYHAGVSEMHGRTGCNEFCVGISLLATHESGFTDSQYRSLSGLTRDLMTEHPIQPDWIQGHEDVARPLGRKPDPGPRFDWDRYRAAIEFADA